MESAAKKADDGQTKTPLLEHTDALEDEQLAQLAQIRATQAEHSTELAIIKSNQERILEMEEKQLE